MNAVDEEGDTFTLQIESPHDAKFEFTPCGNVPGVPEGFYSRSCKIKPKVELDHEAQDVYDLKVRLVYDAGTPACEQSGNVLADVTITVHDVDEPETLALSPDTVRACTTLTGTLEDTDDVPITVSAWKWERADTRDGTFTVIDGATASRYTAADADVGKFLKATVSYSDTFNRSLTKTEHEVTGSAVVANAAPVFTSGTAVSVQEGSTAVAQVTATDSDSQDTARYAVTGGADRDRFAIGETTGDLVFKTAPQYDAQGSNDYEVVVTVTSGAAACARSASQTITVTVTALPRPLPPADLQASADGTSTIRLSWTAPAPAPTNAPVTGYRIEVSPAGTGSWSGDYRLK